MKYLLFLFALPLFAQTNAQTVFVVTAPSGACSPRSNIRYRVPNGTLYTCQSGTWALASGGGTGNVSASGSFTNGDFSKVSGTDGKTVVDSGIAATAAGILSLVTGSPVNSGCLITGAFTCVVVSSGFDQITSGTNAAAAMVVGT